MKRKRHIRWDRLILVILCSLGIISIVGCGIYKLFNKDIVQPIEPVSFGYHAISEQQEVMPASEFIEETKDIIEPEPAVMYAGEFRLTSYCSCPICCGVWSGGPTYSGVMPTANHTIAVDPDVIPLGTKVKIEGFDDIIFVAEDTGSAINENHIDIYCDTHEECFNAIYNRYAEVYIVEEV